MSVISILYVDDDENLLNITRDYIEHLGDVRVDTARSVGEAREKIRERPYDAIISDYQMPDIDGIAFLKMIRLQYRDMPFILFSGKGREEVIIDALNCGADFFVQKGGNPKAQFAELMNMVFQAVLRRQSEVELARSERRLHDIINFLPDATFVIDRRGKVISWNYAMEEMTGIPAGEMVGKGEYEYAVPLYGERREMLADLVMASDDELAGKPYLLIRREGSGIVAETSQVRPRGRERHLWAKANPLYDDTGTVVGAVETMRDITEIRQAENALVDANRKLSLLGSVTRHDIRNRMTALIGFTDLARRSGIPPETSAHLGQVIRISQEILHQIDFAQDYEDLGVRSPVWQNVAAVIDKVLEGRAPAGIRVGHALSGLECFADPLFSRVIDNLIDNTERYGAGVTRISFTIWNSPDGQTLVCEDDGVGIPADAKERIFERGYGKNTGLGLFLAREILAITGMTIRETGEPGRGARFEILMPSGRYRYPDREHRQDGNKHFIGADVVHT